MNVKLYNQEGKEVGQLDLPAEIFGVSLNKDLIHQAAVEQMAGRRQVLAQAKDRGQVRGGGTKPWRQKGTGRARHGSIRSPIWIGGGVTFGPTKERTFSKKINRKMKRQALLMAMSSKLKDDQLVLLDKLELSKAKTKQIIEIISHLNNSLKKDLDRGTLIILPTTDQNIIRASQNVPKLKTIRADSLNVLDILSYRYLLIPQAALKVIKRVYLR